jgi:flagellar motor switch protein FliN/FliY
MAEEAENRLTPEEIEALIAAARQESAPGGPVAAEERVPVRPATFPALNESEVHYPEGRIQLLLDVPLTITVELGRSTRTIREILTLGPGSIVELNRSVGEPVDILANGALVARGEVVVVDETFAVRIVEIVSQRERLMGIDA